MEYYARITKSGPDFIVSFPEFPNINTYGLSLEKALAGAREALNATLEAEFERGYALPEPDRHGHKRSYHPIPVLPHVELAVLEGQEHNAMDTVPREFAERVLQFLLGG